MNILFLTLNSFSTLDERGIYTDLLREFTKENHNLFIITPLEKRKNKPNSLNQTEKVSILNVNIGNLKETNLVVKGITILKLESVYKRAIAKYFKNIKFDLILYSTPPITLQKAINYVKKRDNAKTYLILKDIFPQNAVDLEILNKSGVKSMIYKHFRKKEKDLYMASDFIGCMSQSNVEYILKHNCFLNKDCVEICPNSIEPQLIRISSEEKLEIRKKYQIPLNKTIFIYGGNLGKPQGIDFLIETIQSNEKRKNAYFLIVGSGSEHSKLKTYFNMNRIYNSKLMDQLPKADYEMLANSCDVGMIFLDKRFTIPNFPSRILSYMQASMPILAATDSSTDLGEIILRGQFGSWSKSGDLKQFDLLADQLCDNRLREKLGANARKYLEQNYTVKHTYNIIMNHFI